VQLVLANEGSDQGAWQQVVDQLVRLKGGPHPLVAVTGLGISLPATRAAAKALSDAGIPQVGSILTATDMVGPQLFKVSPSNEDYAAALRQYVQHHPPANGTYLVYDRRDDNYVQTLRAAFVKEFGAQIGKHQVSFLGETGAAGAGTPQLFVDAVQDICLTQADHVLYAGRDIDLLDFIKALSDRGQCGKGPVRPLTVLTGATGLGSAGATAIDQALANTRITLVNASSTDTATWIRTGKHPDGFEDFLSAFRTLHLADVDLQDGYTIMSHDAVLTAVLALRRATVQTGKPTVTGPDVLSELLNLHDAATVPAASGTLTFDGSSDGWPHGKPVPIIIRPAPSHPAPLPLYTTP
jgi:ABC-type branched-subunit amino acid transport system substrate-binding protein